MPFTPEEIDSKEFLITLRGYDKDEVKAFLKAVAADYRAALESATPAPAATADTGTNAYEALGKDIGQVLQVAKQSADQLKRKAEEEATAMRRRAEEEANTLREAASNAARRLTEEAERHAVQVRAEAERDASERTLDATRRVEKLQSAESKLRQRLYALEMMLQSMRQELESADANGSPVTAPSGDGPLLGGAAAAGAKEPPPPPTADTPSGGADAGDSSAFDFDEDREPLGGSSGSSS